MKKSLLYFVFVSLFVFSAGFSFGQCTPDPSIVDPDGTGRMDPDTIEAQELVNTGITLTIIAPDTASVGGGSITIDHITLRSLQNKPSWLNYVCTPSACEFNGSEARCVLITGTPPAGSAGYTSITVLVDVYSMILGTPVCVTCATSPDGYDSGMPLVVHVSAAASVAENTHSTFGVIEPQPNPFNSTTKLGCFTETPQTVKLRVYNMVGGEVYSENLNTNAGENYFNFNGSDLNDGVYFYSIMDENKRVITEKFIKSR